MKAIRSSPVLFIALLLGQPTMANENNALSPAEAEAGWTLLFDGKDLSQWRNYGKAELGDGDGDHRPAFVGVGATGSRAPG